jgi:hypothetical protein
MLGGGLESGVVVVVLGLVLGNKILEGNLRAFNLKESKMPNFASFNLRSEF